jgi:hypothetical protein
MRESKREDVCERGVERAKVRGRRGDIMIERKEIMRQKERGLARVGIDK